MRNMIALFGLAGLLAAPVAGAQTSGEMVGQWTRPDGFRQTTLISRAASLQFAVPGDWKALQVDLKLPVAMAVYDVPDPSSLDITASNTNCSMAFADPATAEGQAVIARAGAFGGTADTHNGWATHHVTDTADAATTAEIVALKPQGQVTAVAMCAWSKGGTHDAAYDVYMTKIFDALIDSVQPAPSPFKPRPGETFFTPQ